MTQGLPHHAEINSFLSVCLLNAAGFPGLAQQKQGNGNFKMQAWVKKNPRTRSCSFDVVASFVCVSFPIFVCGGFN